MEILWEFLVDWAVGPPARIATACGGGKTRITTLREAAPLPAKRLWSLTGQGERGDQILYSSSLKSPCPPLNLISLHLSVRRRISGNVRAPNCTRHGEKCLLSELETAISAGVSGWTLIILFPKSRHSAVELNVTSQHSRVLTGRFRPETGAPVPLKMQSKFNGRGRML